MSVLPQPPFASGPVGYGGEYSQTPAPVTPFALVGRAAATKMWSLRSTRMLWAVAMATSILQYLT